MDCLQQVGMPSYCEQHFLQQQHPLSPVVEPQPLPALLQSQQTQPVLAQDAGQGDQPPHLQQFQAVVPKQFPQGHRVPFASDPVFDLSGVVRIEYDEPSLQGVVNAVVEYQIVDDGPATYQIQFSVIPEVGGKDVLVQLFQNLFVPEETHRSADQHPEGQRRHVARPAQGVVVAQQEESYPRSEDCRLQKSFLHRVVDILFKQCMKMKANILVLVLALLVLASSQEWITPEPDSPEADSSSEAPGSFVEQTDQPQLSVEPEDKTQQMQPSPKEGGSPFYYPQEEEDTESRDLEDPFAISHEERMKKKKQMHESHPDKFAGRDQQGLPHKRDRRDRKGNHGRRDSARENYKPSGAAYQYNSEDCMEWMQNNPELCFLVGFGLTALLLVLCLRRGKKQGRATLRRQAMPQVRVSAYPYPQAQPTPVIAESLQSQIRFHEMQINRLSSQPVPLNAYPRYPVPQYQG